MKPFALALAAAVLAASTASADTEILSAKTLEQYVSESPNLIFEDPEIECRLSALLGEKVLSGLQANMEMMEFEARDASGAYPFPGGVRGLYTISEGFVLLHPNGAMWVGYLHDGTLEYFTNDAASATSFPPSFARWAEHLADATVEYRSPPPSAVAASIAARCSADALRQEIAAFTARQAGTSCDDRSKFNALAVVVGTEKARFLDSKGYLVEGDVVRTAGAVSDSTCASYTDASGRAHVGRLPNRRLSPLDGSVLEERARGTPAGADSWVGIWHDDQSELSITKVDPTHLHVEGRTVSGAHTGEVDDILEIGGNRAVRSDARSRELTTASGADSLPCRISLYRFNNGILATDDGECGGIGVTFYGFYRPGRSGSLSSHAGETGRRLKHEERAALESSAPHD